MIPGLKGKETLMPWYRAGGRVVCLLAAVLFLLPANSFGSWSQVEKILTEAYGAQTARECSDYYDALNIPGDQVTDVRDSIARLVEALSLIHI